MKRDVFISHAGDDASVAVEVCALLEKRGLRCWMAPRDVAAGSVWDEAILDAIETSRVFLLILSKSANQSQFVKNEVNRAFSQSKPIVTFRLEDVPPGRSLELYLARHHWTDAFPPPLAARVENLASSIIALLDPAAASAASAPIAPAAPPTLGSRLLSPMFAMAEAVRGLGRVSISIAFCALLLGAAISGLVFWKSKSATGITQAVRFTIPPEDKETFSRDASFLSISPDGSKLAFVAGTATGGSQLWIRPLDSSTAQGLPGTENGAQPFWSPDSRFIGFFADGKLKKIDISGGPAQTLTDAPSVNVAGASSTGGTWNREGVILFTSIFKSSEVINRVSDSGGVSAPVTTLDNSRSEIGHLWPQFLPDGKHFFYLSFGSVTGGINGNAIFLGSLDSKEKKLILSTPTNALYVSPGYLLFARQGTLMAQPFDTSRLQLTGEAVPIAERVQIVSNTGRMAVAASDNGVLAYRNGAAATPLTLVWVNRSGTEQRINAPNHNYVLPRLSPDGQRIAFGIEEGDSQIWLYDLSRDALTRLTFDGTGNVDPVWTPDGKRIVFKGKANRLFWQPADGGGAAEDLTSSELSTNNVPGSWSPDGQVLAITEDRDVRKIYILPLKDRKPHLYVEGPLYETSPRFSPDGRWIAYSSTESGKSEIYVRPYPDPGGKWQVSTEGGTEPAWNPKGRELFFRSGTKMMSVEYSAQPTFSAGRSKLLFEGPYVVTPRSVADYDVSSDGQRFLMLKAVEQTQGPAPINVVLNWFQDLKQKAPTGKN